jgi:hypothetical protein
MKLEGQGDARDQSDGGESNEEVSYFALHDFYSFVSGWKSLG